MILDWIFQSSWKRVLKKAQPIVKQINELEAFVSQLTQTQMLDKIKKWKVEYQNKKTDCESVKSLTTRPKAKNDKSSTIE